MTVTVSECLLCARPCAKCFPIASSPQLGGGGGGGGITTTATLWALVSQKRMLRLRGVKYISWKMVEWEPQSPEPPWAHSEQTGYGRGLSGLKIHC